MGFATIGSLFGAGGGDAAALAAKQNAQQQFAIDQGSQSIDAIFGGGTGAPSYFQAGGAFDPATQYYKAQMKGGQWQYSPYTAPGSKRQGVNGAFPAAAGPNTKHLFTMTPGQQYQGFSPNFFQQRADAYTNFALPQLGQQYDQANRALQYGFANQGLSRSSAQQQAQSDLNLNFGQAKQNIIDTGTQQAQSLQQQIEQARENALSQLYQSANPAQAGQTALNTAQQFTAPSVYQPIGNAFSNILNQYALRQAYNNTPQLGYSAPATNFNANSGALPSNS